MFEILTQKHNLHTMNENEILVRYGGTIGGQFYGYTTYKIDIKTSNTLLKIIPKKYRQDFEPALISINIENVIPIFKEFEVILISLVEKVDKFFWVEFS